MCCRCLWLSFEATILRCSHGEGCFSWQGCAEVAKKLPHVRLQARWSFHFHKLVTQFSLATRSVCHIHSAAKYVEVSRAQRMVGTHGLIYAAVPLFDCG